MSAKIPPSERIRQLVEGYLQGGYQQSEQSASEFLKLAAQMVAQEALEQEVTDFLGRERYERQEETVGYRNGYKPGRMRSAEGEIELSVPQVRETEQPYRSRLMEFFKGNTDVLDDLEASLAFLRCPITHHRRIRTTNLIERAFAEQRRRTKVIPRFFEERSCLKLVFATLWQASERWQRVSFTDLDLAMLRHLRRELELDPSAPEASPANKKAV